MTVIEIRRFRNSWKSYEGPGVEPVFGTKEEAISYGQYGGVLCLCDLSDALKEIFRIVGLDRTFPMFATVDEAANAIRNGEVARNVRGDSHKKSRHDHESPIC